MNTVFVNSVTIHVKILFEFKWKYGHIHYGILLHYVKSVKHIKVLSYILSAFQKLGYSLVI